MQLRSAVFIGMLMLGGLAASAQERWEEDKVREALFALDRKHGGRLGVAILDSGNGRIVAHRGEEPVEDGDPLLGVQALEQRRRAAQVAEEHARVGPHPAQAHVVARLGEHVVDDQHPMMRAERVVVDPRETADPSCRRRR